MNDWKAEKVQLVSLAGFYNTRISQVIVFSCVLNFILKVFHFISFIAFQIFEDFDKMFDLADLILYGEWNDIRVFIHRFISSKSIKCEELERISQDLTNFTNGSCHRSYEIFVINHEYLHDNYG